MYSRKGKALLMEEKLGDKSGCRGKYKCHHKLIWQKSRASFELWTDRDQGSLCNLWGACGSIYAEDNLVQEFCMLTITSTFKCLCNVAKILYWEDYSLKFSLSEVRPLKCAYNCNSF